MTIGVVKEIKNNEFRVGLTPDAVSAFVQAGHPVLVEKGAGLGSGFPDEEYVQAGATLEDTAEAVWNKSGMIVKVKEPIECEYRFFRKDLILYTYLHLAADAPLTKALMESGVKAIAYETIVGRSGGLPCLTPMSEIAGRMSVQEGAKYLEKTFGGRPRQRGHPGRRQRGHQRLQDRCGHGGQRDHPGRQPRPSGLSG